MDPKIIKVFNSFKVVSALPMLKLLCVADKGIHKTDLDRRLSYTGPGVEKVGLYEAKETVAIKVDNNTSEFPKRTAPDKLVNVITIDNIRFKILLDRIGRFSSTDTGRQQLTGALLEINDEDVFVTVTDGKRIYREKLLKIGLNNLRTKIKTIIMLDPNSRTVLNRMMDYAAGNIMIVTINVCKESVTFDTGAFELTLKCMDGKQYPNTDVVLKTERACMMYQIIGLPAAVKFLKQFAKKDGRTMKLYTDKAALNEGTYGIPFKVQEIKGKVGEKGVTVTPKVKGEDMNPCLITLAMAQDETDKSRIATFHFDYVKDIADVLGDRLYMFFNKEDGYGYFLGAMPGNKWM